MYKLSKTSKMPGKSFSIPSSLCKMGSKLSLIEGSVCSKCYAKKGSYCYPAVKSLRQGNYDHYIENKDTFIDDLKTLIQAEYLNTGVPYFRWFDSGDLQSYAMLSDMVRIAYALPHIQFWLPTKELDLIKQLVSNYDDMELQLPANINIRVSVFMVDGNYLDFSSMNQSIQQTRVISKDTPELDSEYVCLGKCVECNYACWDDTVNVAYIKH